MAGRRPPGPVGISGHPSSVDSGTLALVQNPVPGPMHADAVGNARGVSQSAATLESDAVALCDQYIGDGEVRALFVAALRDRSDKILAALGRNQISPRQARSLVHGMRNQILNLARLAGGGDGQAFVAAVTAKELFLHPSAREFFEEGFAQRPDAEKRELCRALIENLGASPGLAVGFEHRFWALTACLVWTDLSTRVPAAEIWSKPRPRRRFHRTVPAEKVTPRAPAPRPRPAPAPAAPEPATFPGDQDAQAATLVAAADEGVPFCEECEKARQERAAAGGAAAS